MPENLEPDSLLQLLSTDYKFAVSFSILVIVLLFRPSGIFKGKKIDQPLDFNTRPLKDLTKESIFNIIKHSNKFSVDLDCSEILDLFSGTGSFGIECLSRGAKHVTFVENYNIKLLR